jgi:hypothetical protein
VPFVYTYCHDPGYRKIPSHAAAMNVVLSTIRYVLPGDDVTRGKLWRAVAKDKIFVLRVHWRSRDGKDSRTELMWKGRTYGVWQRMLPGKGPHAWKAVEIVSGSKSADCGDPYVEGMPVLETDDEGIRLLTDTLTEAMDANYAYEENPV